VGRWIQNWIICALLGDAADTFVIRTYSAIWAPQWWIRPLIGCLGLTLPKPNDYDQLRIRMRLHNVLNSA
jgi:hypothetical protein